MKSTKYPFIKTIVSLLIVVVIVKFIFNYKYYTGSPMFIAGREYGICYKELILKDNNTYHENSDCEGSIRGDYKILNDTIYFEEYKNAGHDYKYGLIENNLYGKVLNLYNKNEVFETQLPIQMNKFKK